MLESAILRSWRKRSRPWISLFVPVAVFLPGSHRPAIVHGSDFFEDEDYRSAIISGQVLFSPMPDTRVGDIEYYRVYWGSSVTEKHIEFSEPLIEVTDQSKMLMQDRFEITDYLDVRCTTNTSMCSSMSIRDEGYGIFSVSWYPTSAAVNDSATLTFRTAEDATSGGSVLVLDLVKTEVDSFTCGSDSFEVATNEIYALDLAGDTCLFSAGSGSGSETQALKLLWFSPNASHWRDAWKMFRLHEVPLPTASEPLTHLLVYAKRFEEDEQLLRDNMLQDKALSPQVDSINVSDSEGSEPGVIAGSFTFDMKAEQCWWSSEGICDLPATTSDGEAPIAACNAYGQCPTQIWAWEDPEYSNWVDCSSDISSNCHAHPPSDLVGHVELVHSLLDGSRYSACSADIIGLNFDEVDCGVDRYSDVVIDNAHSEWEDSVQGIAGLFTDPSHFYVATRMDSISHFDFNWGATLMGFIRPDVIPSEELVIVMEYGSMQGDDPMLGLTPYVALSITPDRNVRCTDYQSNKCETSDGGIESNVWAFVACSVDQDGIRVSYFANLDDGTETGSEYCGHSGLDFTFSSYPSVFVGNRISGADMYFEGNVDEVSVFKGMLDTNQLMAQLKAISGVPFAVATTDSSGSSFSVETTSSTGKMPLDAVLWAVVVYPSDRISTIYNYDGESLTSGDSAIFIEDFSVVMADADRGISSASPAYVSWQPMAELQMVFYGTLRFGRAPIERFLKKYLVYFSNDDGLILDDKYPPYELVKGSTAGGWEEPSWTCELCPDYRVIGSEIEVAFSELVMPVPMNADSILVYAVWDSDSVADVERHTPARLEIDKRPEIIWRRWEDRASLEDSSWYGEFSWLLDAGLEERWEISSYSIFWAKEDGMRTGFIDTIEVIPGDKVRRVQISGNPFNDCENLDDPAMDPDGLICEYLWDRTEDCADAEFSAWTMCCACGGGVPGVTSPSTPWQPHIVVVPRNTFGPWPMEPFKVFDYTEENSIPASTVIQDMDPYEGSSAQQVVINRAADSDPDGMIIGYLVHKWASEDFFNSGCSDLDDGATDQDAHDCSHYSMSPWDCGQYDDDDFSAGTMCCACYPLGDNPSGEVPLDPSASASGTTSLPPDVSLLFVPLRFGPDRVEFFASDGIEIRCLAHTVGVDESSEAEDLLVSSGSVYSWLNDNASASDGTLFYCTIIAIGEESSISTGETWSIQFCAVTDCEVAYSSDEYTATELFFEVAPSPAGYSLEGLDTGRMLIADRVADPDAEQVVFDLPFAAQNGTLILQTVLRGGWFSYPMGLDDPEDWIRPVSEYLSASLIDEFAIVLQFSSETFVCLSIPCEQPGPLDASCLDMFPDGSSTRMAAEKGEVSCLWSEGRMRLTLTYVEPPVDWLGQNVTLERDVLYGALPSSSLRDFENLAPVLPLGMILEDARTMSSSSTFSMPTSTTLGSGCAAEAVASGFEVAPFSPGRVEVGECLSAGAGINLRVESCHEEGGVVALHVAGGCNDECTSCTFSALIGAEGCLALPSEEGYRVVLASGPQGWSSCADPMTFCEDAPASASSEILGGADCYQAFAGNLTCFERGISEALGLARLGAVCPKSCGYCDDDDYENSTYLGPSTGGGTDLRITLLPEGDECKSIDGRSSIVELRALTRGDCASVPSLPFGWPLLGSGLTVERCIGSIMSFSLRRGPACVDEAINSEDVMVMEVQKGACLQFSEFADVSFDFECDRRSWELSGHAVVKVSDAVAFCGSGDARVATTLALLSVAGLGGPGAESRASALASSEGGCAMVLEDGAVKFVFRILPVDESALLPASAYDALAAPSAALHLGSVLGPALKVMTSTIVGLSGIVSVHLEAEFHAAGPRDAAAGGRLSCELQELALPRAASLADETACARARDCSFTCDPGFQLYGEGSALCSEGSWLLTGTCAQRGVSGYYVDVALVRLRLSLRSGVLEGSPAGDTAATLFEERSSLLQAALLALGLEANSSGVSLELSNIVGEGGQRRRLQDGLEALLDIRAAVLLGEEAALHAEAERVAAALSDFGFFSALSLTLPKELVWLWGSFVVESLGPPVIQRDYFVVSPGWVVGQWGKCTQCGDYGRGRRSRSVVCGSSDGDDAACTERMPADSEECPCEWEIRCPWGPDTDVTCDTQLGLTIAAVMMMAPCLCCLCYFFYACCKRVGRGTIDVDTDLGHFEATYQIQRPHGDAWDSSVEGSPDEKTHVVWKLPKNVEEDWFKARDQELALPIILDGNQDLSSINIVLDEQKASSTSQTREATEELPGVESTRVLDERDSSWNIDDSLQSKLPRDRLMAYRNGDDVEYFSRTLGMWLQGKVYIDKKMLMSSGKVIYDVLITDSRQVRIDVHLHDLRPRFTEGEKLDVLVDKTWLCGEIVGESAPAATRYGHKVKLVGKDEPCDGRLKAIRLRRRYEIGEEVEVFLSGNGGWRSGRVVAAQESLPARECPILQSRDTIASPRFASLERNGSVTPESLEHLGPSWTPWARVKVAIFQDIGEEASGPQVFSTYLVRRPRGQPEQVSRGDQPQRALLAL